MNRAMGAPQIDFTEREGVRYGLTRRAGMEQEWVEVPWNWVSEQWAEVTRVYSRGFSTVIYSVFLLEPLGPGQTRVSTYYGAVARGLVGRLALKYGFPGLKDSFQKVLTQIKAQVAALHPALALSNPAPLSPEGEAKLKQAEARVGRQAAFAANHFELCRRPLMLRGNMSGCLCVEATEAPRWRIPSGLRAGSPSWGRSRILLARSSPARWRCA